MFEQFNARAQQLAPVIVRVGVALVFLWFGGSQLNNATDWIGWLPSWVLKLPIAPTNFIYANGAMEVLFGAMLLVGLYVRFAAFVLALHMAGIVISVGYNEIGVRDFGILCATIAVWLYGPDVYSLYKK
ncbi:MAG TPA: DoxX family protein [Candidatus Paceibacterota bacterium]